VNAIRGLALLACSLTLAGAGFAQALITEAMIDGDSLTEPLDGAIGDARRGEATFVSRDAGHCVLCHQVERLDAPFQGNVGPKLDGIGALYTIAELRLRVAQIRRIYPDSVMPEYYRLEGLNQVGAAWQGEPALSAQQIEDIVAFLATLS